MIRVGDIVTLDLTTIKPLRWWQKPFSWWIKPTYIKTPTKFEIVSTVGDTTFNVERQP